MSFRTLVATDKDRGTPSKDSKVSSVKDVLVGSSLSSSSGAWTPFRRSLLLGVAILVLLLITIVKIQKGIHPSFLGTTTTKSSGKSGYTSRVQTDHSYTCAPWLKDRKILFYGVETWDQYYRPGSRGGGENYVMSSLAYALEQLGFEVDQMQESQVAKALGLSQPTLPSAEELKQYHRIFANGINYHDHLAAYPDIRCKIRLLHFWGNWPFTDGQMWEDVVVQNEDGTTSKRGQFDAAKYYLDHTDITTETLTTLPYQYDPRQILAPYPEDYNTFLGYFVHSLVWQQEDDEDNNHHPSSSLSQQQQHRPRPKQGLIVGRRNVFTDQAVAVMQALLDDGFALHSICTARSHCGLPAEVQIHSDLDPHKYAIFMKDMAFLIGFGHPIVSPSPLEGLAQGAAWLNPIESDNNYQDDPKQHELEEQGNAARPWIPRWRTGTSLHTQHQPLSLLGMPYVYNYHLDNIPEVLQAARDAVQYRFDSYVPWEYRPSAMVARACAIVEDEAVCSCTHYLEAKKNSTSTTSDPNDCRGSTYIRNPS